MTKNNSLNIYLIKDGFLEGQIFKDFDELSVQIIKENYNLYYNEKNIIPAKWAKNFFQKEFLNDAGKNIFNSASSQAVLVAKIKVNGIYRIFAICFGTGYHLLKLDAYEQKFGLYTVLNLIGENSLRRIDKQDVSGNPKYTAEQLSQKGGQIDFGLNVDMDILRGVVGTLDKKDNRENRFCRIFGTTLSGKSNLNLNAPFNIDNIDVLLRTSYIASQSNRYKKKGYDWVDNITAVKNSDPIKEKLFSRLDEYLVDKVKHDKIWLSIPELIEWQDVDSFYFKNKKNKKYADITFDALQNAYEGTINTENLKKLTVNALHSDQNKDAYSWNVLQCLYAEIDFENYKYILINSSWYKANENFLKSTDTKYQTIIANHYSDINFNPYLEKHKDENGYNRSLQEEIPNSICMDAKNIYHGGKYDKIEFCDVFDVDNSKLIHVKKYSGSNVLSHLFAQGLVSAELLINDSDFRQKVEDKILQKEKTIFKFKNDIENFEVVFAIIAKPERREIPLFSKINFNSVFSRINNMRGFKASIAFIDNNAKLEKDAA